MSVFLTKSAIRELSKRGESILFFCRSAACHSLEYVLKPIDREDVGQTSTKQVVSSALTLWVCNKSMFYLLGTEIGWKEDMMGSRFVFSNPNAMSMCGCGNTFST